MGVPSAGPEPASRCAPVSLQRSRSRCQLRGLLAHTLLTDLQEQLSASTVRNVQDPVMQIRLKGATSSVDTRTFSFRVDQTALTHRGGGSRVVSDT